MSDKILQISTEAIVANASTYLPKPVSISNPKLVTSSSVYNKIVTAVQDHNLIVTLDNMGEEVLPNPSLFKRAQDFYTYSDTVSLDIKIPKYDKLAVVTDLFSRAVSYRRVFQEPQITSDSYKTFIVNKGIVDTNYLSDANQKHISKLFNNTSNILDVRSINYGKQVLDAGLVSEVVNLAYKKSTGETIFSQDLLSRTVNFNRTFVDYVDATDDFYGYANLDDDQIAKVGKGLVDWLASSDIHVIRLNIIKTEIALTTDIEYTAASKILLDSYTTATELRSNIAKLATDSTLISDYDTKNTGKTLVTSSTTSDIRSVKASKVSLDFSNTSEQVKYIALKYLNTGYTTQDTTIIAWSAYRSLTSATDITAELSFSANTVLLSSTTNNDFLTNSGIKVLSSPSNASDTVSRTVNFSRTFTDYVGAADDFYGFANLDDDQLTNFGKNTVDWVDIPDTLIYTNYKVLSEVYAVPDIIYSANYKVVLDTLNNTDIIEYSMYKALVTSYTASNLDTVAMLIGSRNVDTIGASSVPKLKSSKILSDVLSNQDNEYKTTNKVVIDYTLSSDSISFYKFTDRYFNEIAATLDSGVINNQSYFAESYVEAGYVGTNTYFY